MKNINGGLAELFGILLWKQTYVLLTYTFVIEKNVLKKQITVIE